MRRSTGPIFRDTRPETIITSACRGLARNTSEPNLARSLRADVAFIISIAQHARPKVAGQSEDFRAQLIRESSWVVSTSGRASPITFSSPITTSFKPPFSFWRPVGLLHRRERVLPLQLLDVRVRPNQKRLFSQRRC